MHALAPLIYDLAIMLGLAAAVVIIFQRIKQPVVLGYLIVGMITGPHTPPHTLISDVNSIHTLSMLGVIFLMFSLGLEFSFKKLTRVGLSATFTGVIEVVIMICIGYGLGSLLGFTHFNSLFLAAALSISSTTIIVKALEELHLKTKDFAELVFGVLIIEDLIAVLLLVLLSTIVVTHHVFSYDVLSAIIKVTVIVSGWFIFGYFLVPPFFRSIAHYISEETLTIVSVALCLLLVVVAVHFHYSAALGAFIMGSILAGTILIKRIETVIKPIRDIFATVFFISVGMMIDPQAIFHDWKVILLISVITIIGKIMSTTIGAFFSGKSLDTSIRSGFSMAQIGEFSFIIIGLGMSLKVIDARLYPLIVAVSGITTFTTPYLISVSSRISHYVNQSLSKDVQLYLKQYSLWLSEINMATESSRAYAPLFIRVTLNGIVVAGIFTIFDQIIFDAIPYFYHETWISNAIAFVIAMIVSSPFLWGMLFSYRKLMVKYHYHRIMPLLVLIWIATFSEVALLGVVYFESWLTFTLCFVIALILFVLLYRKIEISYRWFERNLIKNMDSRRHNK